MKDKFFLKKEKVADLLFDLVKYLLTAIAAITLFSEKSITPWAVLTTLAIALIAFITAVVITPIKED
ncbi:MAG: hypothetical protein HY754_00745 [Nitrospirae bacterium]|nr:hypothetical protein [Nitrospirota bacterium]